MKKLNKGEQKKVYRITETANEITMPKEIWQAFLSAFDSMSKALEFLVGELEKKKS